MARPPSVDHFKEPHTGWKENETVTEICPCNQGTTKSNTAPLQAASLFQKSPHTKSATSLHQTYSCLCLTKLQFLLNHPSRAFQLFPKLLTGTATKSKINGLSADQRGNLHLTKSK